MKRTKCIFIILFIVYALVAIGSLANILRINNNVLLGLSFSALLISISDVLNKVVFYRQTVNFYQLELLTTLEFLKQKIDANLTYSPVVNIRNFTEGLKALEKKNHRPSYPDEYINNKCNIALEKVSFACFVLGIAAFIVVPFIQENIAGSAVNMFFTIIAFAFMNLSVFFDEMIQEEQEKRTNLINDKHLIIQCVYPDFLNYFHSEIIYRKDAIALKEMQEKARIEAEQTASETNNQESIKLHKEPEE